MTQTRGAHIMTTARHKTLKALPNAVLALFVELSDYVSIAYRTATDSVTRPEIRPALIEAGNAAGEAMWMLHLIATHRSARDALAAAMAAVRAAAPIANNPELEAADLALREWLWRERILPEDEPATIAA